MKAIIISIIVAIALIGGVFILKQNSFSPTDTAPVNNVSIVDGKQIIEIQAKGGYQPRKSIAKAGIPTKLIMKTNGTYDCSASLVIRSVGFQEILPQTGEIEIDLGTPKAGEPLRGVCGMGMYSFLINFQA